jgi:hypothetical protein
MNAMVPCLKNGIPFRQANFISRKHIMTCLGIFDGCDHKPYMLLEVLNICARSSRKIVHYRDMGTE